MDFVASTDPTYHSEYGKGPKLTTTNYYAWSKSMQYILLASGVWHVITGEELPPGAPPANANTATRELYEDRRREYKFRCNKAAAMIYMSCSATVQVFLDENSSPQENWQSLKDRTIKTSDYSATRLRSQFYNEQYNGEGSVSTFIAKVLRYQERLAHTPQALNESDVVSHLLLSLPPSWLEIRTLFFLPAEIKTLDYTINALVDHEKSLLDDEKAEQPHKTDVSPAARGNRRSNGRGQHRGRGRIEKPGRNPERNQARCWYCSRPGHKERECRTKKAADKELEKRTFPSYTGFAEVVRTGASSTPSDIDTQEYPPEEACLTCERMKAEDDFGSLL
jgi:hypothetical protein